ncbi:MULTISPECIES: type IV toxin-antitoxin system AbiEi family antitoxin domain-containing protein [unclassified Knoellia]|uniref:type IV toxin-antitoxin system AbiEi family antitoxin domain-containing protein n=1 Tax=Knoellia altitudinis TaxID=3404795 RepID=UPI0036095587
MNDLIPLGRTEFALFTTAEATRLGLDRKALARLRSRGHIESVCRGVYAVGTSDLSPQSAHRRLACAGLLLYPDAAVSHASSLALREVPTWLGLPERVDLMRPLAHEILTQSFRMRPRHGTVDQVGDLPACDVATSLIRYTMDAGPTSGTIAADHALRLGLVDRDGLEAAYAQVSGHPHSGRCQMMLTLADGTRESVGESRLGVLAVAAGIHLVPQVTILDEDGEFIARVDFVVEGTRIVVEFDGRVKYTDGGPDALFAEKRREDRLRRLGYTVIRVSWADLQHPGRIAAWIRSAVAAA